MPHALLIITLTLLIIITLWARRSEKKRWNNGVCKETGKPWEYFDTDSQGGRGYKSGDYSFWASYNVDGKGWLHQFHYIMLLDLAIFLCLILAIAAS